VTPRRHRRIAESPDAGPRRTYGVGMSADTDAVDVVRRFCAAWAGGDLDAIMGFFADDAVYHNIPVDPVTGTDAIRSTIEGFTAGVESIEFRVDHIVGEGDVVLTERVDIFSLPAKAISLPVMGTFEVRDGKITAWRDYFDMNQFMSQLAG
jgi:limonene-1,2-epoxide hydrolase